MLPSPLPLSFHRCCRLTTTVCLLMLPSQDFTTAVDVAAILSLLLLLLLPSRRLDTAAKSSSRLRRRCCRFCRLATAIHNSSTTTFRPAVIDNPDTPNQLNPSPLPPTHYHPASNDSTAQGLRPRPIMTTRPIPITKPAAQLP